MPLRDAGTQPLLWTRVDLWRGFNELHQGDDIFAMLQWTAAATGRTAEGSWTFTPVGQRLHDVEICWRGFSLTEAVYECGKRGRGTLSLVNGRTYAWNERRWSTDSSWELRDGTTIVRMNGRSVNVEPGGIGCKDLSVLFLLGQYLNVQRHTERMGRILGPLGELIIDLSGDSLPQRIAVQHRMTQGEQETVHLVISKTVTIRYLVTSINHIKD